MLVTKKDLEKAAAYLEHAAAHADEGRIGEAAARSILEIATTAVEYLREIDVRNQKTEDPMADGAVKTPGYDR